jgi:DNA-binding transcriptional LysR family regulator
VRTASLDLNLLTALTALLEERHVSRAARRVGLSQSAMSEALGRLRRHFGDELLLRVGNRYELTPLAAGLRVSAGAAMELVEQTFSAGAEFDPGTCDREFVLLCSDYAASVYGPHLMRAVLDAAPRARLRLLPIPREPAQPATVAGRGIDGFLMPRGMAAHGFVGVDVFRDGWVCLVDDGNETVGQDVTLGAMAGSPWVVQDTTELSNPVLTGLRAIGIQPRIECVVGDFHSIPFLVRGSARIGVAPSRLLGLQGSAAGVRALPAPFETPPVVETLWWHVAHTADPAHRWLRETAVRAGACVTPALGRRGQ